MVNYNSKSDLPLDMIIFIQNHLLILFIKYWIAKQLEWNSLRKNLEIVGNSTIIAPITGNFKVLVHGIQGPTFGSLQSIYLATPTQEIKLKNQKERQINTVWMKKGEGIHIIVTGQSHGCDYQCKDGTCIGPDKWCNNVNDCIGREDEEDCCQCKVN